MMRYILLCLLSLSVFPFVGEADACGPDSDCMVGDRHYRIRLPEGYESSEKIGAIIYAHGYRGSAKGMMKNESMAALANELGVALIATKSYEEDWRIPGVPRNRETDGQIELTYYDAVIADVTSRFPIDPERMIATGFSAGGMMVWNLICHRSELFAGFVPIAGTFWQPEPTTCTTPPASIIHIHGNADKIVPLMGRPIADTHQGEVPTVLEMYSRYGGYTFAGDEKIGELSCQNSENANGSILNFCLFEGGHSFKSDFVRQAWKKFEKKGML